MRASRRNRNTAFTLVEVLVALAIVSIGMLVVIQAVSQTVNNSAYLRDKTVAHWIAMNQLTLLRIAQSPPSKGTTSGEEEMVGQRWHWTAEVTPTAIDSMLRIDVSVRSADGDDNSQLTSVTGFYGAKIAKPGTIIAQYSAPITTVTNGGPTLPVTQPIPRPQNPQPPIPGPANPQPPNSPPKSP